VSDERESGSGESAEAQDHVAYLLRISAAVLVATDLDEQLRLVAEGIVSACNFRRCVISLLDRKWNVWKRAHAGLTPEDVKTLADTPPISAQERQRIFQEALRVGSSYFVPHDSHLGSLLGKSGVSSKRGEQEFVDWHPEDFLFVPMYGKEGRILGTISVDDPIDGRRPTAQSLRILELFAREAAFAIEQSDLLRALRRTENYLESLISSSPDAIVTTDTEGRIVVWNEGAEKMLGWRKDEIVGKSVLKVYAEEKEAREIMRRLRSATDEKRPRGHETELISKSGERIPVALSASALRSASGEFLGTAGISRDLRPWKALEEERRRAEKVATLSEVAATVCHEINNFLEEILSAGQVSLLNLEEPELRTMFEKSGKIGELEKEIDRLTVISREALKIAALTNQLQSLARGGEYATTEYVGDIRMVDLQGTRGTLAGKILVADDREFIREFLRDFLVLEGFEVDVASDGKEAIEKAKLRHYDVVLSDIKMPEKNGYEVFAAVRESDPATQVILMTAYGYDPNHSIVKAAEQGLTTVLYKPFQMARVREAIVKALGGNGKGPCE
jgi:PAS domain S-box-containing protein